MLNFSDEEKSFIILTFVLIIEVSQEPALRVAHPKQLHLSWATQKHYARMMLGSEKYTCLQCQSAKALTTTLKKVFSISAWMYSGKVPSP